MVVNQESRNVSTPEFVSSDRRCAGCGYNLKGLRSSGECPECGRPISRRRRAAGWRGSDHLVHAPMSWLIGFRVAAVVLMFSATAFLIFQTLTLAWPSEWAAKGPVGMALAALGWWAGIVAVTRPRPVMPGSTLPPGEEWNSLRWICRISQLLLPIAALANIAIARIMLARATFAVVPVPAPPSLVLSGVHGAALFIGAAGLVFVCIYLSNICFWAADTTLAVNFRACAWSVGLAAVANAILSLMLFFSAWFAGPGAGVGAAIGWPVLLAAGIFLGAGVLHMLWCLWRLQDLASWAVIHHATVDNRTERLRERAAQMTANTRRRRGAASTRHVDS